MDIDKPYLCYKITNSVNGKGYVGQTCRTLDKRWTYHVGCAFWNIADTRRHVHPLHRAIRKYGPEAFTIDKISEANTLDDILIIEQNMIVKHNTYAPTGHGYNMTLGGPGTSGYFFTEEVRKRMSKAHLGRKRGPHSENTKRKISETKKRLGHGPSLYCNQRRSETGTGRSVSLEVREKIRQTLKGRPRPTEVVAKIIATKRRRKETTNG